MAGDEKKINPQVKKFEIGRKDLREITIYPLAVGDTLQLNDIITNSLQDFFATKDQPDEAVVGFILKTINENLGKIIEMLTCGDEKGQDALSDLTHTQSGDLIEIIYHDNFGGVAKKLKDLFVMEKEKFLSERSSPDSLSDTLSTDLNTSLDETSEKGE